MTVDIKALYRSTGHSYKGRAGMGSVPYEIESCESFELVAGSFFDWAVYEEVKTQFDLPELEASAFRRNALISGVDLNSLIGKEFSINGVTYSGSEEAAPCFWMNEACAEGVHEYLMGKGGLRCRIHNDGSLGLGSVGLEGV